MAVAVGLPLVTVGSGGDARARLMVAVVPRHTDEGDQLRRAIGLLVVVHAPNTWGTSYLQMLRGYLIAAALTLPSSALLVLFPPTPVPSAGAVVQAVWLGVAVLVFPAVGFTMVRSHIMKLRVRAYDALVSLADAGFGPAEIYEVARVSSASVEQLEHRCQALTDLADTLDAPPSP